LGRLFSNRERVFNGRGLFGGIGLQRVFGFFIVLEPARR